MERRGLVLAVLLVLSAALISNQINPTGYQVIEPEEEWCPMYQKCIKGCDEWHQNCVKEAMDKKQMCLAIYQSSLSLYNECIATANGFEDPILREKAILHCKNHFPKIAACINRFEQDINFCDSVKSACYSDCKDKCKELEESSKQVK